MSECVMSMNFPSDATSNSSEMLLYSMKKETNNYNNDIEVFENTFRNPAFDQRLIENFEQKILLQSCSPSSYTPCSEMSSPLKDMSDSWKSFARVINAAISHHNGMVYDEKCGQEFNNHADDEIRQYRRVYCDDMVNNNYHNNWVSDSMATSRFETCSQYTDPWTQGSRTDDRFADSRYFSTSCEDIKHSTSFPVSSQESNLVTPVREQNICHYDDSLSLGSSASKYIDKMDKVAGGNAVLNDPVVMIKTENFNNGHASFSAEVCTPRNNDNSDESILQFLKSLISDPKMDRINVAPARIMKPFPKKTDTNLSSSGKSYRAIISKAILSSPDCRLLLKEIYAYFEKKVDRKPPSWKNSVRNSLSINDCFIKIKNNKRSKPKSNFWSIHPYFYEEFSHGNFRNRGRKHAGDLMRSCPEEGVEDFVHVQLSEEAAEERMSINQQ